MTVTPPAFNQPIIKEPSQANPPAPTSALGPFEHLIGTWTNQDIHGTNKGGREFPYSYNVMPLPQISDSSPAGYILKNFSYYEEITFSAIHGNAPNRGGKGTQVANTVFYEQRIYFAEGPAKDELVHAENGSWLYLTTREQYEGPYGTTPLPDSQIPVQPESSNVIKQISVPHGNSILAYGGFKEETSVSIPPVNTLPSGIDTSQYNEQSVGNPNVELTLNPNLALINALEAKKPTDVINWDVNSDNPGAGVINIPFEEKKANVTQYQASYWLESFEDASTKPKYSQLQYNQIIWMNIPIKGQIIRFPHVTTNTLTKIST